MSLDQRAFLGEAEAWLQHWPEGLIALDQSHNILFISPYAQQLLGYTGEHFLAANVHATLCAHSRDVVHTTEACPLMNQSSQLEVQSAYWLCANGNNLSVDYRIFSLSGGDHVSHKVITFQSNSERLHNQAEMEKFAVYVDHSPAPMGEFDQEGQLLFANPSLQEKILAFGFNESGCGLIFPETLMNLCATCCGEHKDIHNVEIEIEGHWFAWHFYPIIDQLDDSVTVIGYAFDITHQKVAEAEVAKRQADARRDFYAKMVHELRTPLNAIVGFSQVLLRRTESLLSERDLASLKAIRAAGLQLNEMVSDTLDISKIEAGKMEVQLEHFVLNELVEHVSEQLLTLAEAKQLQFKVTCEPNLECYCDKKKVRQIIVNLVSNAIKYTPQGSVEMTLRKASHVGSEPKANAAIELRVEDTGIGIPEDQIDGLFRAYTQVSEAQNKDIQGTGLGLALVAELVNMLGGDISVESQVGKGSTFTVILPARHFAKV